MATYRHPEKRDERPPTETQVILLRQIVATNGGGVDGHRVHRLTLNGLIARHLVQAKAGAPSRVVHTPLGLKLVRDEAARTATPTNIDTLTPEQA